MCLKHFKCQKTWEKKTQMLAGQILLNIWRGSIKIIGLAIQVHIYVGVTVKQKLVSSCPSVEEELSSVA